METHELLELLRKGQFANSFGHVQNSLRTGQFEPIRISFEPIRIQFVQFVSHSSIFGSNSGLFELIRAVRISFAAYSGE